jgi:hypothetical protein
MPACGEDVCKVLLSFVLVSEAGVGVDWVGLPASRMKSASFSVPAGSFKALKSAYGTRRYCAWPALWLLESGGSIV